MKPEEILAMLRESVEKWNTWKEENRGFTADLSAVDLSRMRLRGINFKKAFMPRAVFLETYLREAHFEGANLERALFRMADLGNACLRSANLYKANFRRADLWKADFSRANLKAADLGKAILQEAMLDHANLEKASLQGANLQGASLVSANLRGANLQGAHLKGANFRDAILDEAIYDRDAVEKFEAIPDGPSPEELPEREAEPDESVIMKPPQPVRETPPPEAPAKKASHHEQAGKTLPPGAGGDYPPGTVFGPYELKSRIARGGMGVIYLAFDRSLHREVAIKILSSDLRDSPEYLQRFLQEARMTAQMDHPNIISIFSITEEKGEVCVAMQLVKGRNIAQLLKEKTQFELNEALMITRAVASALAYAHERGLIHRDIKPDNIMIDEQKRVKVMDFGIARDLSMKKRITQEGHFMGTIHYSAPEQWSSDTPDPRSDIYSLGIVLFEMLSGKLPFDADSPMSLLYKITREPAPPVSTCRSDIPDEVDLLIRKMMARDLARRYGGAEEVVTDIDRLLKTPPQSEKIPGTTLGLADFDAMVRRQNSMIPHMKTPNNILLMLEELIFATRGTKKFLKLLGKDIFYSQLGNSCIHTLFRETVRNEFEEGVTGSRFPVLGSARKGKTLTEEEVSALKSELESLEKLLENTTLASIWSLSFDTASREVFSKRIDSEELAGICSRYLHPLTTSDFKNCSQFFSLILQAYKDVCDRAAENKTGAYWAEIKQESCQELP